MKSEKFTIINEICDLIALRTRKLQTSALPCSSNSVNDFIILLKYKTIKHIRVTFINQMKKVKQIATFFTFSALAFLTHRQPMNSRNAQSKRTIDAKTPSAVSRTTFCGKVASRSANSGGVTATMSNCWLTPPS